MSARSRMAAAALASGWLLVGVNASVGSWVIDDFSVFPFETLSYDSTTVGFSTGFPGSGRIAGTRQGSVRGLRPSDPTQPGARVAVTPDTETLVFETGPDSLGYLDLEWAAPAGVGTFDLLQEGNDRLRLRFLGDESVVSFGVRIESLVDGETAVAQSFFGDRNQTLPLDPVVELPFDGFFGEVDFSAVTSIQLSAGRYPRDSGLVLDVISAESTPLAGDYDRNGVVDLEDLDQWVASAFHSFDGESVYTRQPEHWSLAVDGNADGMIDAADYAIWRDAFDAAGGAAGAVPEPSTTFLAVLGLLAAGGRRALG